MVRQATRTFGPLIAGIGGWIAVYAAITALVLGLRPPDYDAVVSGLIFYGVPYSTAGATLVVGSWWALGGDGGSFRTRRVMALTALAVLAGIASMVGHPSIVHG